jgi:hypothetical protein
MMTATLMLGLGPVGFIPPVWAYNPTIVGKKKADDSAPEDDRKESQVVGFRAVYVFERLSRDLRPRFYALG